MAKSHIPSPLFLLITFAIFVPRLTNAATAPAIFVFGDSTSDVGTNTHLDHCSAKAIKSPYGINFPNSTATGRWSDGFNVIDHLCRLMVEFADRSPEPYIVQEKNNDPNKFKTGVSFASAGSGLLNKTGSLWGSVSMFNQTEQFIKVRDYLYKTWGQYTFTWKISKSIFLISMGSNDIIQNFNVIENRLIIERREFIDSLMEAYRGYIQKLYDSGARKFAVISVIAMGCCPGQRRSTPNGECSVVQNNIALEFYAELDTLLTGFKSTHPNFHYALGNTFEMMMNAIDGKSQYDLKVLDTACCGTYTSDKDIGCGEEGATTCCGDPNEYAFWDGYHPTDSACNYTARTLYHGNDTHLPKFVAPITFKQLITEI